MVTSLQIFIAFSLIFVVGAVADIGVDSGDLVNVRVDPLQQRELLLEDLGAPHAFNRLDDAHEVEVGPAYFLEERRGLCFSKFKR